MPVHPSVVSEVAPAETEALRFAVRDGDQYIRFVSAEGEVCDKCGRPMLVRWNKNGRFLGCSGYPECKSTRSLDGPPPEGIELGTAVLPAVSTKRTRAVVGWLGALAYLLYNSLAFLFVTLACLLDYIDSLARLRWLLRARNAETR